MDNSNMEYRINLEKQNKPNDQVTELILDNCRASQISGLTDEFVNLETLSLINVGLVTLKGFPKLPKLKKLELSDNRLTGGLYLLHGSPKLQSLNIGGNRIKDFDALEPLKEFHDLITLDLYNCDVTKTDNYRQKVFELLPNLHSLDGYDRNEREVADSDESEDEGSDVENRITREDNDDDDDDEDDGDDEEADEEDVIEDESNSDGELDVEENGNLSDYENYDEEDEDEEDEDDEGDDDDDENNYSEEERAERRAFEAAPITGRDDSSGGAINSEQIVENGDEDLVREVIDDDDDDDQDDEEDEDDDDDGEIDGSDLKQLQKDIGEDDDSDDDDFEPTHEPDARDFEIDPEDDGDDEEDNMNEQSTAHLSTSITEVTAEADSADSSKLRGQKRKHEDEGGDEVENE